MKDKKQKPIVVSFSGGKTSAYMAKSLLDIYGDRVHFVFANTGAEHQETLDFIKRCQDNWNMNIIWIEAKVNHSGRGRGYGTTYTIVDYESASRDNEPFEEVIKKYGLPSPAYLHCTRELKEQPITAWANDNFGRNGYKMAIGIRADEIDRINLEVAKKRNIIYPLADWGIKLQDISGFWEMQDFTLNIPSYLGNCVACYKKTDRKLFTIARENPNYFIFFDYAGEKYKNVNAPNSPRKIYRSHRTASDIVEQARLVYFEPWVDSKFYPPEQGELDLGGGCGESCEVFSDNY